MKVTILSGSGRYQDEWHDFTATSVEVARSLERMGLAVAVRAFKPHAVAQDVPAADLVVVNSGHGEYRPLSDGPEDRWAEAFQTLRDHRARGGALLALHMASNTLDGLDEWPEWVGGRWVQGRSMHPPIGEARVEVTTTDHPITAGLEPFSLFDELYCHLEVAPTSKVLLHHEYEGEDQPLVWVVERDGGRTVYDALGHDVRSFASAGRIDLLRREVQWLLGTPGRR
jgi:type 1 glutamine amidotransferase